MKCGQFVAGFSFAGTQNRAPVFAARSILDQAAGKKHNPWKSTTILAGGFNPFEKILLLLKLYPGRGEHDHHLAFQ